MRNRSRSCSASLLAALLVFCVVTPSTLAAQQTSKPIFTDNAPWLCVGGAFVAMVGLNRDAPLIVVRIGSKGIAAPQTIPLTGNEVTGLQCSASRIEVLAWKGGLKTPAILPFTVGYYEIYNEPLEQLDWPNSQRAQMPPAIKH
jgi:hypothetical protein